MSKYELRDGSHRSEGRDLFRFETRLGLIAFHTDDGTQGEDGAGSAGAGDDGTQGKGDDDGADLAEAELLKASNETLVSKLKDRNTKIKKLLDKVKNQGDYEDIKKKLSTLEAAEEKRRQESLTKEQAAIERAEKAELALAAEQENSARASRMLLLKNVSEEYRPFVEPRLKDAMSQKGFDFAKWEDEEKTKFPALWGDVDNTPGAAGGHARGAGLSPEQRIAVIEKEITDGRKQGILNGTQLAIKYAKIERIRLGLE